VPLGADEPTEALVSAAWASEHRLGIGDELLLTGGRRGLPPLRIVGLLEPRGFGALEGGDVLVVSRTTLDEAFEVPAPIRSPRPRAGRPRR
jgi:hypothetical protein